MDAKLSEGSMLKLTILLYHFSVHQNAIQAVLAIQHLNKH